MAQNTSTAVMARRVEPLDGLDDFPTPPWAGRALCEQLLARGCGPLMTCLEPAANRGYLVRGLRDYFVSVEGADIHDYGAGFRVDDFLFPGATQRVDWIITNPPFRLAQEFVEAALRRAALGVAMFCRSSFAEGRERYATLWSVIPPTVEYQFVERVVLLKGRLIRAGDPDPTEKNPNNKASTATSYSWFVWTRPRCFDDHGNLIRTDWETDTRKRWIPPCRLRLEREGDYPEPEK